MFWSTPPCTPFTVIAKKRFRGSDGDNSAAARAVASSSHAMLGTFAHMRQWEPEQVLIEEVEGMMLTASGEDQSPWEILQKDVPEMYLYKVYVFCASVFMETPRKRVLIHCVHTSYGGGAHSERFLSACVCGPPET